MIKNLNEARLWVALSTVRVKFSRQGQPLVVSRETMGTMGADDLAFQDTCQALVEAHESGLTCLREINKDRSGRFTQLVFEQLLTPAGEALLRGPSPRLELEPEAKAMLRARLERQLRTGISDGELFNREGVVVGKTVDFFTPDQVRANARAQLDHLEGKGSA